GTYIRNLIYALAKVDQQNQYVLVASSTDAPLLSGLPQQFEVATYNRDDTSSLEHIAFPLFLRRFSADVYPIPLNRVPLFMLKPYVEIVHDLASLLFDRQ